MGQRRRHARECNRSRPSIVGQLQACRPSMRRPDRATSPVFERRGYERATSGRRSCAQRPAARRPRHRSRRRNSTRWTLHARIRRRSPRDGVRSARMNPSLHRTTPPVHHRPHTGSPPPDQPWRRDATHCGGGKWPSISLAQRGNSRPFTRCHTGRSCDESRNPLGRASGRRCS